jgi:hypothetical protein
MSLDRHGDKMIAERKGRTVNHGKEAIEMALQRIASVAKILRKGAIVMLRGRSQLNENLQGDECILQQISALRRENRFLKVGLIFCIVLSALPYLTGFQPTVIRASKVVTERVEFVRGGKTVMLINAHPKSDGLVVWDKDESPVIWVGRLGKGGAIGVYNKDGEIVAGMETLPTGGRVEVCNNEGKTVASMDGLSYGGSISVSNNDLIPVAFLSALPNGGSVWLCDKKGNTLASMDATPICGTLELKTPLGRTVWSAP